MTGAVQHHCGIQTHSISSLLDTITHLTPGTQPRQEPRQPDPATYRQPDPATPGNPAKWWWCSTCLTSWRKEKKAGNLQLDAEAVEANQYAHDHAIGGCGAAGWTAIARRRFPEENDPRLL